MCCCKYLDNQTSCPSRQSVRRRRDRLTRMCVCGGGERIHPHTNAAYLRLPLPQLHVHMTEPMDHIDAEYAYIHFVCYCDTAVQ